MSENLNDATKSRKKSLTPIIGGAVILLLAAGSVIGVLNYNAHTEQLCAHAVSDREASEGIATTAVGHSKKAYGLVESTANYGQSEEGAALISEHSAASAELKDYGVRRECSSRDDARTIESMAKSVTIEYTRLDDAAQKLSAHVIAFREAEKTGTAAP